MKYFNLVGILSLIFLTPKLFAVSNLLINGQSYYTLGPGDSAVLSCVLSQPGDTVVLGVYLDRNDNGNFDSEDRIVSFSKLIDGDWTDNDELPNAIYSTWLKGHEFPAGRYFFVAKEGTTKDTAVLVINPLDSNLFISGTILSPPLTPGIMVFVSGIDSANSGKGFFAFTNQLGVYRINIPEEYAGTRWLLYVLDICGAAEGYLYADLMKDTVFLNGPVVNHNISLEPSNNVTISGQITDNFGNPITDSILIVAGGYVISLTDTNLYLATHWAGGGTYEIPVIGQIFNFYLVTVSQTGLLYPDYLVPGPQQLMFMGNTSQTLDIVAYKADTTITGHVYQDNLPKDKAGVIARGYINQPQDIKGTAVSGTYVDGHYTLKVSAQLPHYRVEVDPNSIPEGATVQEGVQIVSPGATGVDFHIVTSGIAEGLARNSLDFIKVTPNPARKKILLEVKGDILKSGGIISLFDESGRKIETIVSLKAGERGIFKEEIKLPVNVKAGVYFLVFESPTKRIVKRLVILR